MTIKRCVICGKGFSTKKSKLDIFCSIKCKLKYDNKLKDFKGYKNEQIEMDFKAKEDAKNRDFRLPRKKLF